MLKIYQKNIRHFLFVFVLCFAFILLCRLVLGEKFDISKDLGYVAVYSALYAGTSLLYPYTQFYVLSILFVFWHLCVAGLKIHFSMLLPEREITHTICYSLNLFTGVAILFYAAGLIKFNILRKAAKVVVSAVYAGCLLPPMTILGYFAVNNALFSTDIIMTLFQTNFSEALDYLMSQNVLLWTIGILVIIALIGLQIYVLNTLKTKSRRAKIFVLAFALCAYAAALVFPKLNLNYVHNLFLTTQSELQSFSKFKNSREAKVNSLKQLNLSSPAKGVYVLVIGESLTKDHMQLYGYSRKTTPWLSNFAAKNGTMVFKNAYANHTHTVPTLSYALSEKNQYNDLVLEQAATIIDAARAAGYKTYWLSNQLKYSVYDTPVNIIGTSADVSKWINTAVGDKLFTQFYDEKLIDFIPDDKTTDKALIVIHLMGNHSLYQDRYPKKFEKFHGAHKNISEYDNSVLYNDYVVGKIYERVSQNPEFMAFVYFADHGDDVDNGLGHNSSLFSYPMARIPLIVNVSYKFARQNTPAYYSLYRHQNEYWTNDLAYDLMVNLMQIKGLPNGDKFLNLLSDEYYMPEDKVKLLHGEKKLPEEK